MFKKVLACASLLASTLSALQREDVVLSEEFLSPAWEQYDCHSSSLVQNADGEILVVWKAGLGKGKSNFDIASKVGIWQVRFDGKSWSDAEKVHFEPDTVVWNPVLGQLASGELLLFFRAGAYPWLSTAFMKRSMDGGKVWSDPAYLPAGIVGPSKNKPLVLKDGTMLCPSSTQVGDTDGIYPATAVWIDFTSDGGQSWNKSKPLVIPGQPFGAIEPALFFDQENNLRLLCRDRACRIGGTEGMIWTAVSQDNGKTWSPLEKTDLPNPDSAFDVVDLGEGELVLIYNHSHTQRFPLSIAISRDGGKTWERKCDLEEKTGEFPAAIQTGDKKIHVAYAYEIESGQRRIKHAVLDADRLFSN
ncbi:MAG: exo-alpha-sialidase [Verrucomicrobia bacterium]|nr:exo-alpha-sialidase [Verrucomicrobiota bacterium]